MDKRSYSAPQIREVKLEIKNSILAVCNISPTIMDPRIGPVACSVETGCYAPGGSG